MRSFVKLVNDKIKEQRLSIRKIAKEIGLDPSFFSKVLSGKRSPPTDDKILKKLAELLNIDPLLLIISTGTIPSELQSIMERPEFIQQIRKKQPLQMFSFEKQLIDSSIEKKESPSFSPDFIKLENKKIRKKVKDFIEFVPRSADLSEDLL